MPVTKSDDMLVVQNLKVQYGGLLAVNDISLSVKKGEFISLLGPSGCGKTTLLRAIAGYVTPSSGRLLVGGEDVTDIPPRKRRIGMVFQNYALFPHMTVWDNIAFPLQMHRWDKTRIARRVKEMLEIVQLPAFAERFPHQMSGGQQQRVALARALAFDPQLLLLDEPLGALDLRLREAMQTEIRRLQRETGVTAIFVTHDQAEAFSMSDRVAVVNAGKIEQVAPPRELYNYPHTAFVADFVGRSNVIPAKVSSYADGLARFTIGDDTVTRSAVADGDRQGSECAVSIRPENLRISRAPGEGHLAGEVIDVQYNGLFQAVRVRTDASMELVAHDNGDWQPGMRAWLNWNPTDARIVLTG